MTLADPFRESTSKYVGQTDPFTGQIDAKPDFQRDRYGRPLIVPRGETKPVPYQRASSMVDDIDPAHGLLRWGLPYVTLGLARDRSLLDELLDGTDGKEPPEWDEEHHLLFRDIHGRAKDAGGGDTSAKRGTYIHELVERINLGETVDGGPYEADLGAYREALRSTSFNVVPSLVEFRGASDALRAAGTCDMVLQYTPKHFDPDRFVADLKTGTTIEYALLAYAAQLAVYANSDLYNPVDHSRTPLDVSTEVGYLIHLPAGQGRCTIYEVDLVAGYKAAKLANTVRRARTAAKGFATKVHEVTA